MLLERSFIAIEQGNFRFCLRNSRFSLFSLRNSRFILEILVFWGLGGVFYGILEFPTMSSTMSSSGLTRGSQRHCEGVKRPKLGILVF